MVQTQDPARNEREQDHDEYILWLLDCGQRLRRALGLLGPDGG